MSEGLFDNPAETAAAARRLRADAPLAERMRPQNLEEIAGQAHLVGSGGALRRAFEGGDLGSMVFWGPPGTGKTTLAQLLAARADLEFVPFSAVLSGIKEVREAMEKARRLRASAQRKTLLFVDEIHRFNKAQQDAFLPFVERGDVVLVGATTENPSFEIVGPLLSRVTVHILQPLSEAELVGLLRRALADCERGLGARELTATDEQLLALARLASGDARRALGALEAAARLCDLRQPLPDSALQQVLAGRALLYDKAGDQHYDLISALHKSVRNSDPDAALYWLVRMLEAGEDRLFLARRLVRMAAEDIGLADPGALRMAMAARDTYHFLGTPEGEIALAELAIYLALAPKSNAVYTAYEDARTLVRTGTAHPVPLHLRNAATNLMKEKGWGAGYQYAHDHPGAVTNMTCLPDALVGHSFYQPTTQGLEARIRERLDQLRAAQKKS
jgi:putative ATPase